MFIEDLLQGGATSLLSGGINYAFQQMAAQHNYQLAEQSAENQYQRQLDFWDKQNAYNTPQQQVNRRLAAGLAPTDGVDSGNASALSSVPGNNVGLNGALQFDSNIDLLQSMRNVQEIRNLGKTGDMLDAQIANTLIQGVLLDMEKKVKKAGLDEMAERLEQLRIQTSRMKKEDKYFFSDDGMKKKWEDFLATLKGNNANANIADKNWSIYNDTGINPSQMNKRDMLAYHAIEVLLEMMGYKISDIANMIDGFFGGKKINIFAD